MSELDQTARYALKIDAIQILRWLLPTLDMDLAFTRWLDTETIAFPGEPRRRCDTVAELVSRTGSGPSWAVVLEVEARPRSTILDRLLEYVARLLRKLRHGPHKRDRYKVAAVLLFLTGRRKELALDMQLPGTDIGLTWKVRVLSLAREKADETLQRIDRGELGTCVLPWVPLMSRGCEPVVVQEWLRLAKSVADDQRRSDFAGLALVFAERAGCLAVWDHALKGWGMVESQVIGRWKQEGRQEGQLEMQRKDLLKVLRSRFGATLPSEVETAVQQQTQPDVLARWFDAALAADSLEAFRAGMMP